MDEEDKDERTGRVISVGRDDGDDDTAAAAMGASRALRAADVLDADGDTTAVAVRSFVSLDRLSVRSSASRNRAKSGSTSATSKSASVGEEEVVTVGAVSGGGWSGLGDA